MKKNQIILISIGALILIGIVFYFAYFQKIIKSGVGTLSEEVPDLCNKFSEIKDTVTCETARAKVLEKYPGEVKYIKRAKASLPVGLLPNVEMVEKEVWLIGVNLNPPMEINEREYKSMEMFVTRDSGELEINYLASGEI